MVDLESVPILYVHVANLSRDTCSAVITKTYLFVGATIVNGILIKYITQKFCLIHRNLFLVNEDKVFDRQWN